MPRSKSKNRSKSKSATKGGTDGPFVAKGPNVPETGGKKEDRKDPDPPNAKRGAGEALNNRGNPINVDGKDPSGDVGLGLNDNNSPARKGTSADLLGGDDSNDSELGNTDESEKLTKTVLDPSLITPPKNVKKHKITSTSGTALTVTTEAFGFERFLDETAQPYTEAEFQPADPEEPQPARKFSTAGRLFAKEHLGVDSYNFPGGFPKPAALEELRKVVSTQSKGPHLKMIMDIQATNKNDLGLWGKTVSCELAQCIWDLMEDHYIVVEGQPSASSPRKPSQYADTDEDMEEEDDGLILLTKAERTAKQNKINSRRRALIAREEMRKAQNRQYSFYEKPKFTATDIPGKNKFLGVSASDRKFLQIRSYVQYSKTAANQKDNQSMVDHLKAMVPPMWSLWPSKPHENFDDDIVTKDHYDVFFSHMRTLGPVQTTPTSQDCMTALLKLVKTPPTMLHGWNYHEAAISNNNLANLWYVVNDAFGSYWTLTEADTERLGPKPAPKVKKSSFKSTVEVFHVNKSTSGIYAVTEQLKDNSKVYDSMTVIQEESRNYHTFITIKTDLINNSGNHSGRAQIVKTVHQFLNFGHELDKSLILYPYPRFEAKLNKSVKAYTRSNMSPRLPKNRGGRIATAFDLNPYLSRNLPFRIVSGTHQWLQLCIGHDAPFEIINNETFQAKLESQNIALYKNDLQCNSQMIIGWLLNAHTLTFSYRDYTKLLQQHPLLVGKEIQCVEKVHRKHPNEPYKKKGDPGAILVAALVTDRNKVIRSKVRKACRQIFNTQTPEMAALRPGGANLRFIDWHADNESTPPNALKAEFAAQALAAQKTWMRRARAITVRGIVNFDYPFEYKGDTLTIRQILTTVKTSSNWRESLFNQINTTWTGDTVAICHKAEEHKANQFIQNLLPLMRGFFGSDTIDHFFEDDVLEANENIEVDFKTHKIVDKSNSQIDDLSMFQFMGISQATLRTAREQGKTDEEIRRLQEEESLDEQGDMDNEWGFVATEDEPKEEWVFDLSKIFDPAPTINLGPHNEEVSLASNRTDTSMYTNTTNTNQNAVTTEHKKNPSEEHSKEKKSNKNDEGTTSDQTNNVDDDKSAEQQTSDSAEDE